jgi:hypothetical protein
MRWLRKAVLSAVLSAILLALLLYSFTNFVPSVKANPTIIFEDGFESGNFNVWTGIDGGSPAVVNTFPHHGTFCCSIPGSASDNIVYEQLASSYPTLYVMAYVRYTALNSGDNPSILIGTAPLTYAVQAGHNGTDWCIRNALGNYVNYTESISVGIYYCVELMATQGTSGAVKLWINGVLKIDTTTNCGTSNFSRVGVGQSYLTGASGGIRIDCVVISDTYIIREAIFSDGFESSFSAWSGTNGTPTVQSSIVHHGAYAALSDGANSEYCYQTGLEGATLKYSRAYYYFDAFPTSGNFVSIMSSVVSVTRVLVYNNSGTIEWGLYGSDASYTYFATSNPVINTWYCVELLISTTQPCQLWVDGISVGTTVGVGVEATDLYVGGWDKTSAINVFWDCVVVADDTYIGPEPLEIQSPSSMYPNIYDYFSVIANRPIVNATVAVTGGSQFLWNNTGFSKLADPNNYATLDVVGCTNTSSALNFKVEFAWNFTQGNVNVTGSAVDNANNIINSTSTFYFETDLAIQTGVYADPFSPVLGSTFYIVPTIYFQGTSIAPPNTGQVTFYAFRSGVASQTTTIDAYGQARIPVPASVEGTYAWLIYAITPAGTSVQNQTISIYIHSSGAPPSGPFGQTTTSQIAQTTFYGSLVSLGGVARGQQVSIPFTITWTGTNQITITNMSFIGPEWPVTFPQLPKIFFRELGADNGTATLTVFVTVPDTTSPGSQQQITVVVTAEGGSPPSQSQINCIAQFIIVLPPIQSSPYTVQTIVGAMLVVGLGSILFVGTRKKKSPV